MSRTPTNKKIDIDLSKPLKDLDQIKMEMDCFGREYEQIAAECQYCSANVICSIITHKRGTQPKIANVKAKRGGFLDEVDYSRVPWQKIADKVKEGRHYPAKDLIEAVGKWSRCGDYGMNSLRVMKFIADQKFTIVKGNIVPK